MSVRIAGALVLVSLIAIPSFAVDLGKAEGSITINKKAVKLKYAFAKKEKDYEEKDRWVVMLTDRPVSRSVLADSSRLSNAVENGELVYAELQFNEAKELSNVQLQSKALRTKSMPIMGRTLTLTGVSIGTDAIEGAAESTEDSEFFDQVASMKAKFKAPIGPNAAAEAELAASRPKIADGGAAGTFVLDGKTVKLAHSIARTKPNSFDEKKTDVVVLLTNEPVSNELLLNETKLAQAVTSGSLRGLKLTIDDEEKPYHLEMLDPEAGFQISGSGFWNFDAYDYSSKHVSGKFFTTETQTFTDKHTYTYDVTFNVPVQAIKAPDEMVVDATTGKPLPANGGEPGKAYMAFDKAARAGNFNELKKYGSKTRALPDFTPDELKKMLELIKALRPANLKVTGGFVDGDNATLMVNAQDPDSKSKMNGTIQMVREDGTWKLLGEKWKVGTSPSSNASCPGRRPSSGSRSR